MVRDIKLPPNQVAFRVEPSVNKLDIRDYLANIYNVKVVDVRTMNYMTRMGKPAPNGIRIGYRARFKKAIVTLRDDFYYPPLDDSLEHRSKEELKEEKLAMKRRLNGWKSRPKRGETMMVERLKKLEAQQKEKENPKESSSVTKTEI